jgi:SAM-dependent methyltransferase
LNERVKPSYTAAELAALVAQTAPRRGWDFSRMRTVRQPVPWEYEEVVAAYLRPADRVLDIGTGGGERFLRLAPRFGSGIGVDPDPEMVEIARENGRDQPNVRFRVDDHLLAQTSETFDVALCRHAPYDPAVLHERLSPGGYVLTQQVGERNMGNVKAATGQAFSVWTFDPGEFERAGFRVLATMEYDVEYVVQDVESLVFWLQALDLMHADLPGGRLTGDADAFNQLLAGNVDERGFVTNEHRYMVVAQRSYQHVGSDKGPIGP